MAWLLILSSLLIPSAHAETLSDQKGCGTAPPAEHAEAACSLYSLDDRLKHEASAVAAARACREYYTHAAESLNLVCNYRLESELLRARAASEGEGAVSEAAAKLLGEASARMAEKFSRLENLHGDYGRALASFSRHASEVARAEATCVSQSPHVPGVLLAGIAHRATEQRVETHRPLKALARGMADQSDMAYYATASVVNFLGDRGGNLGAVLPEASCEIEQVDRGRVGPEPRRPGSYLAEAAGRNGQNVFNQYVTKPIVLLYNPAANGLLTAAFGSALNLGNRVLKNEGKVDGLDYLSVGTALALQVGKTTVLRNHVAAVAIQGVEHLVRQHQYTDHRARAHAAFAKDFLAKNPAASSKELTVAFADETDGKHCAR